jgi:hypothetical protein
LSTVEPDDCDDARHDPGAGRQQVQVARHDLARVLDVLSIVGHEEVGPVLDDRAAEAEAVFVLLRIGQRHALVLPSFSNLVRARMSVSV